MGRERSVGEAVAAGVETADREVRGLVPARDESDPASGRLRVVFMLRVAAGAEEQFLEAYQQIRYQVASVGGHLVDQLCQSTADPTEWMITSEWESPEHFLAWEGSPGHRELAGPLVSCTTERESLRYLVQHQTVGQAGRRL